MKRPRILQFKWIVSIVVTIFVLWIFFSELSWYEIKNILLEIDFNWLLLAAAAYFISTIVRAQRLRYVGFKTESFRVLNKITFLQFFYSNLLPWRTGELAYFYLVKRNTIQPMAVAASSLLITRLFDFIAIVVLLIVSLLILFPTFLLAGDPLILSALGVLILLVVLLALTLFWRNVIVRIARVIARFFRIRQIFVDAHILPRWVRLEQELDKVKNRLFALLLNSLTAWVLIGFMTLSMVESLNVHVSVLQAMFLTVFPPFAALIPLPTLANFGTIEAGWAFGLAFLNFSTAEAFQLSVSLHILSLLLYIAGAIIALLIGPRNKLGVSNS